MLEFNKIRVVIVIPPVIPEINVIGPAYLLSYLKSRSIENVKIINLNDSSIFKDSFKDYKYSSKEYIDSFIKNNDVIVNKWINDILNYKPHVVGFSTLLMTKYFGLEIAKKIKEYDKNIYTVFGGFECSLNAESIIKEDYVDIVVKGEGERTFYSIIEKIMNASSLKGIKGTVFKEDNVIFDYGWPDEIIEIDELPFPDYSEGRMQSNTIPIAFNRGCKNRCMYCNLHAHMKKYRARSAQSMYMEILHHMNTYPDLSHFEHGDADSLQDLNVISELCDILLENKIQTGFAAWSSISPGLNDELLEKMNKSGFTNIAYGLEHTSDTVLKLMNKRYTGEEAEQLIRRTKKAGIRVGVSFIVGFPGEGEKEFKENLDFLKRNRDYIDEISGINELHVLQGSIIYKRPERFNVTFNEYGTKWEINDSNNVKVRQKRIQILQNCIKENGIKFDVQNLRDGQKD